MEDNRIDPLRRVEEAYALEVIKDDPDEQKLRRLMEAMEQMRRQRGSQDEAVDLPPDDPRVQFWRNLKNATIEVGPGGIPVLTLTPGTYFLSRAIQSNSMLLRPCYEDLWNMVINGPRKVILSGTPGVGKSQWLYYVLHQLALMGVTVVVHFESFRKCLCFSSDSVREGPCSAFYKELGQEDAWYLVDALKPEDASARTVLATSPKRDIFKGFAKAGAETFYMPVWSWEEISAGRHLYGLPEDEVWSLFEKWGGSARYVLYLARAETRQADLEAAIKGAELDEIYKAVGNIDTAAEVSHRILHIDVASNYKTTRMVFGSEFIAHKLGERFCGGITAPLENFIKLSAGKPEYSAVRAALFEPLAHRMVQDGGSFDMRDLETGTETTLNLDPSKCHTFHKLSEVGEQDEDTYCIPSIGNLAAVDSLKQPRYLFQMTVSGSHSVKGMGLSKAMEQLKKGPDGDADLIFVVPPDQYPRWRRRQEYKGRDDLRVLKCVRQHVIKLPLKMQASGLQMRSMQRLFSG